MGAWYLVPRPLDSPRVPGSTWGSTSAPLSPPISSTQSALERLAIRLAELDGRVIPDGHRSVNRAISPCTLFPHSLVWGRIGPDVALNGVTTSAVSHLETTALLTELHE